jgi:hypothetical protein
VILKRNKSSECKQHIAAFLFVTFGLALICLLPLPAVAENIMNYIYIESNEGDSSGGHAALQFDNDIFHYQYNASGMIRLEKQDTDNFEYNYRFAANRSLHTSQIDVSKETYSLLRDYFNFQHQTQLQQFKLLDDINKDRLLLKSFLPDKSAQPSHTLRLQGAGLFYNDADFTMSQKSVHSNQSRHLSPTVIALNNEIKKTYGKDFLAQRAGEIISQIKSLQLTQWQEAITTVNESQYPPMVYSFANRYIDLITAKLAVHVIEQGLALRTDASIAPSDQMFQLTAQEIAALRLYRKQLNTGLIKLVNSDRPDWGAAVLINSARLIAVDQSIKQGQLIVIDTFESQTDLTEKVDLAEYAVQLQTHLKDTRTSLLSAKSLLAQSRVFSEMDYSLLEMLANRYTELSKATTDKQAIRFYGANLVPTKSIRLPLSVVPALSIATIERNIQQLGIYQQRYQATLKNLYAYHLINRNCVTELFASINKAVLQQIKKNDNAKSLQHESQQHLGGYIDATLANFIPVTSHHAVRKHYKIVKQTSLPSYRLMKLNESYARENDVLVYLRENNTLSSSVYKTNPDDSFFVFFTDNELLFRPLYGAVNTLAGLGQGMLGLFTWPYDEGAMLSSGGNGILMSLPELLFINMRKGSFKYLPYSHLSIAEKRLNNHIVK